ncbi:MAG: transcription elongation factor GreA [Clostridia bacterium]|nr:transcription elongation factor GreA [Clostridia bacterium]
MAKKNEEENLENVVWLTKDGYKQLQDRLDYLKNVKRAEVSQKIAVARSYGDLSENSEYSAAKDEQTVTENEISELEEKIKKAKVISGKVDISKVSVGCSVKIKDLTFDEEVVYKIVGSTESDPLNGLLSNESPAGKALMGAKVGDVVSYQSINSGVISMKVLDIKN